jgi:hypothetical protein
MNIVGMLLTLVKCWLNTFFVVVVANRYPLVDYATLVFTCALSSWSALHRPGRWRARHCRKKTPRRPPPCVSRPLGQWCWLVDRPTERPLCQRMTATATATHSKNDQDDGLACLAPMASPQCLVRHSQQKRHSWSRRSRKNRLTTGEKCCFKIVIETNSCP